MRILTVRRTDLRITISPARFDGPAQSRRLSTFIQLSAQANRIANRVSESIDDRYWRLEYCKLVARDGFAVLAQADEIAEVASSGGPVESFSGVVDMARVRFACAHKLAAEGDKATGLFRMRLFYRLRFVVSSLIAGLAWVWTLLRTGWGNRLAPTGRDLIAVHGEISNRTRHVLAAASQSKSISGIILLGRPATGLAAIRSCFASEFGLDRISTCRPIGFAAALRSVPVLFGQLASGMRIASATGFAPTWKDEIAIIFRMYLGACAREWWSLQATAPCVIFYGQSGLADTSMLEDGQQKTGATTVHWVHGLSGGWNFAGYSDLGLFKCGHDADMHSHLPDYGRAGFVPLAKVPFRAGRGSKWLLMTNYAHPSNPYFGHGAYDLEISVLQMAAEAARKAGIGPEALEWRPHPVFWSLPVSVRDRVFAAASKSGISLPSRNDMRPSFVDFQTILCTPSTTAIDLLICGILPVIVAPHAIIPETAYGAFPLRGADADELADAVGRLADPSTAARLFDDVWDRIRPGDAAITLDDVTALLDPQSAFRHLSKVERRRPPESR